MIVVNRYVIYEELLSVREFRDNEEHLHIQTIYKDAESDNSRYFIVDYQPVEASESIELVGKDISEHSKNINYLEKAISYLEPKDAERLIEYCTASIDYPLSFVFNSLELVAYTSFWCELGETESQNSVKTKKSPLRWFNLKTV